MSKSVITVRDYQLNHVDFIEKCINRSFFYIDKSPTGSGKTPINIHIAIKYGLKLFVVGPANIAPNWKKECDKYGLDLFIVDSTTKKKDKPDRTSHTFISYTTLCRGKNEYVTKGQDGVFRLTKKMENIIKSKALIIYDEAQDVKNPDSESFKACLTISREVVSLNCGSRIAILSATLFDKAIYAESTFKLLGIITRKELFYYDLPTGVYYTEGYGYEDAVNFCKRYDKLAVDMCLPDRFTAKSCRETLFHLLINIVCKYFSSAMPKPPISSKFIPRVGYFHMDEKSTQMLAEGVAMLKKAVRFDSEKGSVGSTAGNFGAIIEAHETIEVSKLKLFVRLAAEQLNKDLTCKVIIFVWYKQSVHYLMECFKLWNPIQANGEVKPGQRFKELEEFMKPSLTHRILIAHPKAAGIGLSMDDQHGGFARHTFISPNYHFIPIHQCAGRTYRSDTKSDAPFTMVYGKEHIEHSIIEALSRKTEVITQINGDNGITYPGQYPQYHEE